MLGSVRCGWPMYHFTVVTDDALDEALVGSVDSLWITRWAVPRQPGKRAWVREGRHSERHDLPSVKASPA